MGKQTKPDSEARKGAEVATRDGNGWSDLPWHLLLWAIAILFFWPVLGGGQAYYFRDTESFYIPQAWITAQALTRGELPLWEPRIGIGYPFQADPHSMLFYPPVLLLLLFPWPLGYNLLVTIHVPLAGCSLFALLRRWKLSAPAAALGGLSLMFCGYTVSATCLTTLLRGTAWAPLALLMFDRFLESGSRRDLVGTVLVLAIQGSGTDPQYVLFTGIMMALLPLLRPGFGPVAPRRLIGGLVLSALLGGMLLAYQYLPLARLILWSDRVGGLTTAEVSDYQVDPANLYSMALPVPFSDPATPLYLASFSAAEVPFYPDLYWGIPLLCLAFAALGWIHGTPETNRGGSEAELHDPGRGRMAVAAVSLTVTAILLSVGRSFPLFQLLNTLVPILKLFRYPGKYMLIAAVGMGVCIALGFEGLVRKRRGSTSLFLGCAGIAVTGLGFLLALLQVTGNALPSAFLAGDLAVVGNRELLFGLLRDAWVVNLWYVLALAAICLLLVLGARRGKLSHSRALACLALVMVLDLTLTTHGSFPVVSAPWVMARAETGRLIGSPESGKPPPRICSFAPPSIRLNEKRTVLSYVALDSQLMTHLRSTRQGYSSLLSMVSVRLATQRDMADLLRRERRHGRDRLAAALGASHVLRMAQDRDFDDIGREVGRVGPVLVQELPGVTPRAFIAGRAVPTRSFGKMPIEAQALKELPGRVMFQETGAAGSLAPLIPVAVDHCEIVDYQDRSVTIDFDLKGEGLLVLMDAYYPGWSATVDGQSRPILQAAGLVRGVKVREGERQLRLTYDAPEFKAGLIVSLMTGLGCLALCLIPERRR